METAPRMWLVHGAGSGPWVFDGWAEHLPTWQLRCADLQADLDPALASMERYATRVRSLLDATPRPRALCGWSMGGLVAMMAAARTAVELLVLLEPSPPGDLIGMRPFDERARGVYDPEAEYGPFPDGVPARAESLLAREQRRAGVAVGPLDCPLLVIAGREFGETRGRRIAEHWRGEFVSFPGFDHWDLVMRAEVPACIERWAARVLAR